MSNDKYIENTEIRKMSTYVDIIHNGFNVLDVPITYHCNLNCAYCGFFSPLQDKYFINVEDFRKNINRLSKILPSNKFNRLHILGGEPLLHPDINLFFKYAREAFPDKEIFLITNGLLLNRMDDNFKSSILNNNIKICISDYSILKNKEQLIEEYLKHNIKLEFEQKGYFIQKLVDLEGKQDPYKNLKYCLYSGCLALIEDKFFLCSDPFWIKRAFEKYLKVNLLKDNIGESIYLNSSFEELIWNLLNNFSVNYCKYCVLPYTQKEWHVSKNALLEYTNEPY